MMPASRRKVLIALILVLLLVAPLPMASSRSRSGCTNGGCHVGSGYAQYLSIVPQLSGPEGPLHLEVGETSTVRAIVRNDVNAPTHRTLGQVAVTLSALDGVVTILGDATITLQQVTPGDHLIEWQIRPDREAPERLQFTASGLNEHQKVATLDVVIIPLSFALSLSLTRLEATTHAQVTASLVLRTRAALEEVALDPSFELTSALMVTPARFDSLPANSTVTVQLRLLADHPISGELRIHWRSAAGEQLAAIPVVVQPAPEPLNARSGDLWLAGRLAAAAALGALTLCLLSGGISVRVRDAIIARIGGTRRQTALHTGTSALLLVLMLYHGLVLWLGPYRALVWDWHNVESVALGVVLTATALVGVVRTPLRARIGESRWRWLHRTLAFAVLLLLWGHVMLLSSTLRLVLPLPTTPWPL